MPRPTYSHFAICRTACALVPVFLAALLWSQAAPETQPPSLVESLKRVRTENSQLHILYVHGMGADGPGASPSLGLRKSICKFLRDCAAPEGEFDGTDYADKKDFALNAPPPDFNYLGEPLWKTDASGASEEWNASAPYVDHYKLIRKGAPTIYVDEINWWPLVFAAKCRQIIAEDASLAGPNKTYIRTCSLPPTRDPDQQKNHGRFRTYPFISNPEQLLALPARGAKINRYLKTFVLDWGFADAVLAVGPMHSLFLQGIREIILQSVKVAADGSRGDAVTPAPNQEFVIVSHSLGSYLMFSALDIKSDPNVPTPPKWRADFDNVLTNTSKAYFLANQVRLLELANLDVTKNGNLITHLKSWSDLRSTAHRPAPQIVAWSDPSDLLTWSVPNLGPEATKVKNEDVKNAWHWFWLIENPSKAHTTYDQNKRVISVLLPKKERGKQ